MGGNVNGLVSDPRSPPPPLSPSSFSHRAPTVRHDATGDGRRPLVCLPPTIYIFILTRTQRAGPRYVLPAVGVTMPSSRFKTKRRIYMLASNPPRSRCAPVAHHL